MKAAIAAACVVLAVVGAVLFNQKFVIVRRYDSQNVEKVLNCAGTCYVEHLSLSAQIKRIADAAAEGDLQKTVMEQQSFEEHYLGRAFDMESVASYARSAADILCMRSGMFEGSKRAFDRNCYDALAVYALRRTGKYEPYCKALASLALDQAAYEAYGAQYAALLQASAEADSQVAASLYQLVCRQMYTWQELQREGHPDRKTLEQMTAEQQEELLTLYEGDLWNLYMDRLQALWEADNRLQAYHDQMAL